MSESFQITETREVTIFDAFRRIDDLDDRLKRIEQSTAVFIEELHVRLEAGGHADWRAEALRLRLELRLFANLVSQITVTDTGTADAVREARHILRWITNDPTGEDHIDERTPEAGGAD